MNKNKLETKKKVGEKVFKKLERLFIKLEQEQN